MKHLAIFLAALLVACGSSTPETPPPPPTPEQVAAQKLVDYKVSRVFTVDGITIYRFRDWHGDNHWHYFASRGAVQQDREETIQHGEHSTTEAHPLEIQTVEKPE